MAKKWLLQACYVGLVALTAWVIVAYMRLQDKAKERQRLAWLRPFIQMAIDSSFVIREEDTDA
jgi:hypothetical protein